MTLLNREALLKKDKMKVERVDLEDGNFVFVCQMNGRDRDAFDQSLMIQKTNDKGETSFERNMNDFRARLAVHTICDENGVRLLQDEDAEVLSVNKSAAVLEKIVLTAQRLNKISDEDKTRMVKNSEGGEADDSGSDSALN